MNQRLFVSAFALSVLVFTGCNTANRDARFTNPNQPGPVVGNAVGVAAGAVVSNAAGVVVGAAEGAAAATKSTFTNDRRVVRTWRTETTSDGRTIQVPVEIEVDANGRPIADKKS
ncbi:flagellar motor protein MotB [Oleiharenicola lentus]|uniref:flagellar motor protein MotB n=1 Tax=Oleiharenicola lentus TaxID=2508720 RepID=UPI003F676451